jgi:hypothetical protein
MVKFFFKKKFFNRKYGEKSQIKVQEMAFMLIGVFLFFGLVALFAFMVIGSSIQKEALRIREENTLAAITNLADSPEFVCSGYSKINCVDFDKALAVSQNQKYKNFWTFSSLEIQRLSAFSKDKNDMTLCTIENYPNCERLIIYDKKVPEEDKVISFVALCYIENEETSIYQKCDVAKLVAGTEIVKINNK